MAHATDESFSFPVSCSPTVDDPLTEVLRCGARDLLACAVEAEVKTWISDHAYLTDANGHRQVVRNGRAQSRKVVTGIGPIEVTMPRVHDRRPTEQREHFTSGILPPYLRTAKSIEQLIPWLYLKGVSDFRGRRLHRSASGVGRPRLSGPPGVVGVNGRATQSDMGR